MTPAHRTEAVLTEDGKLLLDHLPFRAGQAVEVIVLPAPGAALPAQTLHGAVLGYDQPTDAEPSQRSRVEGRARTRGYSDSFGPAGLR
jgi:hypothetical protein